jgi:hypothetical protein
VSIPPRRPCPGALAFRAGAGFRFGVATPPHLGLQALLSEGSHSSSISLNVFCRACLSSEAVGSTARPLPFSAVAALTGIVMGVPALAAAALD